MTTSKASSPGQTGIWGQRTNDRPEIPTATPSAAPVSATFAPAATVGGMEATSAAAVALAPAPAPERDPDDVTDVTDAIPTSDEPPYTLPPVTALDDIAPRTGGADMDHERNAAIITAKLASFNIPARIIRWNAGPVVTQYEIEPDPSVKVSRIEALSDDLAMALAARTIRVEAPIPGKSVVGLEIPNTDFNVVALRRILVETDFSASESRLTFALGRDVAGHARAADLAKMPHLLIAGATGSGKSVMVNAFIASLLMNATPDDVRLILVDLKRVELAAYNELPHLLVPVITEPSAAKAALRWAVGEMEARYRRFAGATARNIATYNESRADPTDRLPYIVIVVDELADLMMREGKNVEEPIVRLAQKARATGVHMVLATQRPSVNVVTGLIKANFPSRIAFAMASQIDSRTILDAPGAEDLIGRGDMLFQPADMPRPIRLQGVFVADREIRNITEYWRSWDHHYDLAIVENDDEPAGTADDLTDEDADRLLPDAIDVIREYDRASASLLQRRLRVGYARAARMIDQLEARGYVGAVRRLERTTGPSPGRSERRRRGRRRRERGVTTQDRTKRPEESRPPRRGALRIDLGALDEDEGDGRPSADIGRSLPERLYAARDAKGVDLYRAERDTKIRSRYLAAMERGDWRELPGSVYTKGFLRNYAIYLGLDPDEVLAQWHRERGDASAQETIVSAPRPLSAPRKPLTVGPYAVVATLMAVIVLVFAAYIGAQLFRFAKPPVVAVTQPTAAVMTAPADATSYTLRGTATAGASIEISEAGREQPQRATAGPDGLWSAVVELRRGKNEFAISARDPETGKVAEEASNLVITVPSAVVEAPTLTVDLPADGAVVENGAIPVSGKATNAVSVAVTATYVGPATEPTGGASAPSPPAAPKPITVAPADDGTFSVPLELSRGRWSIAVTATSQGQRPQPS